MDKIAICGAGGLGREILWMIKQLNLAGASWDVIGFFDDAKTKGSVIDGAAVLGSLKDINSISTSLSLVVAVADPPTRKKIVSQIHNPMVAFPTLVHPEANTGSELNTFKRGTIITAGVICTTGITMDEFVFINLSSTIGHDVRIGKFSMLMPACHISGNVSIGEGVLIGTGATVLQNLKIGNSSKIGAGAVVTKDVKEGTTVIGIPAREKQ